jgi:UDP-4-amino-4,6-dideoxy-N-acetyl-beta-L-altrosamine transaminase
MNSKPRIPYGKQDISNDDIDAVIESLRSDFLTTGPTIKMFEDALARYTGATYCVAVSNGTAALHLISLAILKPGDKVLTTPNSFLATANSILYVNASPIFVDIQEDGNIDLDLCDAELQKDSSIKAIYGVAFSGNMLDQKKLAKLKDKYNILILEDCAHALGAKYNDINAASCVNSDAAILSFHPVKHMTTAEGGAITTNSEELYKKLLILRNHGMTKGPQMAPWEYEMVDLGFNYRITDMQCALGLSQLKRLDHFISRRIELAKKYDIFFENTAITPLYKYNGYSSYHLYVVKLDFSRLKIDRTQLFEELAKKNIFIQVHYIPINKQPYYRKLGFGSEKTPVMDDFYCKCFSLPLFPALTDNEQLYVVETLLEIVND